MSKISIISVSLCCRFISVVSHSQLPLFLVTNFDVENELTNGDKNEKKSEVWGKNLWRPSHSSYTTEANWIALILDFPHSTALFRAQGRVVEAVPSVPVFIYRPSGNPQPFPQVRIYWTVSLEWVLVFLFEEGKRDRKKKEGKNLNLRRTGFSVLPFPLLSVSSRTHYRPVIGFSKDPSEDFPSPFSTVNKPSVKLVFMVYRSRNPLKGGVSRSHHRLA